MSCKVSIDKLSAKALNNPSQDSLLYKQLLNISDNNGEVAERLYNVLDTQEFKEWFQGSDYLNTVGEPALAGEFYTNAKGERWWSKAINKKDKKKGKV